MNESKALQPGGQAEQVEELEREIGRLQAENEGLKKKVKDLEEELRASKRQAAPFSKRQRKANPKRPGRKAGQSIFRYRPAPAEPIGGEIVEAAVPAGCPSCGGVLEVPRRSPKLTHLRSDRVAHPRRRTHGPQATGRQGVIIPGPAGPLGHFS